MNFVDLLKRGLEQGYWTLEQLDHPSCGETRLTLTSTDFGVII